jgi:hypothetical protein
MLRHVLYVLLPPSNALPQRLLGSSMRGARKAAHGVLVLRHHSAQQAACCCVSLSQQLLGRGRVRSANCTCDTQVAAAAHTSAAQRCLPPSAADLGWTWSAGSTCVLVSRDRCSPAAAHAAANRRCPLVADAGGLWRARLAQSQCVGGSALLSHGAALNQRQLRRKHVERGCHVV